MVTLPVVSGGEVKGRMHNLISGTLPALILCLLLDFVAGGVLGKFFEKIMESYPIILIILPGLMGLRGNIFGAMASRLTTMLHLGEMEPKIRDERAFKNIFLSIILSLLPVLILWLVGLLKVGRISDALFILLIVIVSTIFATLLLGYSTVLATVIPYRRGVDPDTVAAPLVTSVGDLVTVPFLIFFILLYENSSSLFYLFSFIALGILILMFIRTKMGEEDWKVFREVIGIIGILSIVSSISGGMLEHYSKVIYASVLFSVLYPPIADSTGNYGSIIGAKTSTRIHLGEIEGFMDGETLLDIIMYFLTGFLIALLMNFIGIFVVSLTLGKSVGILLPFILLYPFLLLFNMLLAYYLARAFTKLGVDPDNTTVPTITTLGDVTSVIFIVLLASKFV
jgi:mgtE-like transporter